MNARSMVEDCRHRGVVANVLRRPGARSKTNRIVLSAGALREMCISVYARYRALRISCRTSEVEKILRQTTTLRPCSLVATLKRSREALLRDNHLLYDKH